MSNAHEHALLLVASVAVAGGPRMLVSGTHAYFPGGDFVVVGPKGEVRADLHGEQTFTDASLAPRWRKGWRDGLQAYIGTLSLSARSANPVSPKTIQVAINMATKAAGKRKPTLVTASEYSYAVTLAEEELRERTDDVVYGCGDFGCAAQLAGHHGILKVTTDHEEEMAIAAIVRTQAFDGFARIWKGPVALAPPTKQSRRRQLHRWYAYTREVVLVTTQQMPYGTWIYLRELDAAREAGHEDAFLHAMTKFWSFARRHPSVRGIAQTIKTLWRDGYMLGDFHSGNYGIRGNDFVLFDAKATLRAPRVTGRLDNPVKRRERQEPLFDAQVAFDIPRPRRDESDDDDEDNAAPRRLLAVEPTQRLYRGSQVSWVGSPELILKLGWDQVKPRQGNLFDPEKIAYFLGVIRDSHKAGKNMRFPAPPARLRGPVDLTDVAETQAQAKHRPQDLEEDRLTRPYSSGDDELDSYLADPDAYVEENTYRDDDDEQATAIHADMAERSKAAIRAGSGDLGAVVADLLDGNHRSFAAQLAGEPYIWVHVVDGKEHRPRPPRGAKKEKADV